MVSLLATCCGSTQPASEPTAKVSVPPVTGAALGLLLVPVPHAVSAKATAATGKALRITKSRLLLKRWSGDPLEPAEPAAVEDQGGNVGVRAEVVDPQQDDVVVTGGNLTLDAAVEPRARS